MGEARRKQMAEGEELKVIATCPVCKHDFIADGKSRLLVTQYMVAQGQQGRQIAMAMSLPKIACTECGVEFFHPAALEELRKKAKGEVSNIIMAQPRVKLN